MIVTWVSELRETIKRMISESPWFTSQMTLPNAYQRLEALTLTKKEGTTMARPAAANKVTSIKMSTVRNAVSWAEKLNGAGFIVEALGCNTEGDVVHAVCTKNEREHTITPELLEAVTKN